MAGMQQLLLASGNWTKNGAHSRHPGVFRRMKSDSIRTVCGRHAQTGENRYWNPSIDCDGELLDTDEDDYGPDIFVEFLIDFIETNQDRPFFAYYPMVLPHFPVVAPPSESRCSDADDQQCLFESMVAYLDHNVGRLYDKLDNLDLLKNTILVFTSDNGSSGVRISTLNGETVYGGKGTTLDSGIHVPLIVHVPGGGGGARNR